MSVLFDPPPPVLIPTCEGDLFPVRRLFCIGRNYPEHASEMGVDADRQAPFFFTKWAETIVGDGATIAYPQGTADFQHEVELVAAIGKPGRSITREDAMAHVWGFAVGLDMTRRDIQLEARRRSRPWDAGKNVEQSSPIGLLHPAAAFGNGSRGRISLAVNGDVRQEADLSELIHPVDRLIEFLSGLYTLEAGDLIYTGTPAGVAPVVPGDVMVCRADRLSSLTVTVGPPAA